MNTTTKKSTQAGFESDKNIHRAQQKLLLFTVLLFVFTSMKTHEANAQIINTVAGNGIIGYTGDGGSATLATLSSPSSITVDAVGNYYIVDAGNAVIRKINTSGIITTVVGNGTWGYAGDGGAATAAEISPSAITIDPANNLFITEAVNHVVRKVDASGTITTYAGNGTAGYSGDGGPATLAQLSSAWGVAIDAAGSVYVTDAGDLVIRKITAGIITTIAGNGSTGYSGDGGPATLAQLNNPLGLAFDGLGNLFFADGDNNVVRMINTSGTITTFAGNGTGAFGGDGGTATAAKLNFPVDVAINAAGDLFIDDMGNARMRRVNTSGIITTYAGNGTWGYAGDGGPAISAEFANSTGIALDGSGDLFITDNSNNRVRMIDTTAVPPPHHPCTDSTKLTITSATDSLGNCVFTATANVFTVHSIIGYDWSAGGVPVIHHTHSLSDNYTFTLPAGTPGVVNCMVNLVDTNYANPGGACCQAVMTQTVSCAPLCNAFDTTHTRITGAGGDMMTDCEFNLVAQGITLPGWTMAEYDWYILPGVAPVFTGFGPAITNAQHFTFPLGFTGVVKVVFKAVSGPGDTCMFSRIIHLNCAAHTAMRLSGGEGNNTGEMVSAVVDEIVVFPNPADNKVTVTSSQSNINSIQVIDVNGQKVGDYNYPGSQEVNVSLDKLPAGTYLLRINNTTSKVVTKAK